MPDIAQNILIKSTIIQNNMVTTLGMLWVFVHVYGSFEMPKQADKTIDSEVAQ